MKHAKRLPSSLLVRSLLGFVAAFSGSCSTDERLIASTEQGLTCKPVASDTCCVGTKDACGKIYGDSVEKYMNFVASSNGACMNGGSGTYQCTTFATDFYKKVLHLTLGSLGDGGEFIDQVQSAKYLGKEAFSFYPSAQEVPRETDILSFGEEEFDCLVKKNGACTKYDNIWHKRYGHVVVVSGLDIVASTVKSVRIIEQNVKPSVCNQTPLPSFGRTLKLEAGTNYVHGFVNEGGPTYTYRWVYNGIIRHNLAGIYGDTGWHDDGSSAAFHAKYVTYKGKLGWALSDNGGSTFVHDVHGVTLQNFVNTDRTPGHYFGTDGQTVLILQRNGTTGLVVYLVKEGFWGAYKCVLGSDGKPMGGAEYLGAPKEDEQHAVTIVIDDKNNSDCTVSPNGKLVQAFQRFDNGCAWYRNDTDGVVHIHLNNGTKIPQASLDHALNTCHVSVDNNPPGPNCFDDCTPGQQVCNPENSVSFRLCGHPGPDSCYHWIDMSCASGFICQSGNCVASSSTGSGGAASSTGGASSTGTGGTSSGAQLCTPLGATRCISGDPNNKEACIHDSSTGIQSWSVLPCPWQTSCTTAGDCTGTPPGTGGTSSGGASSSGGIVPVVIPTGGTGPVPSVTGGAAPVITPTGGTPPMPPPTGGTAVATASTGGVTVIIQPTGGTSTGGRATGGISTGGVATGGRSTGGSPTGGTATGGTSTGGKATGGTSSYGGTPAATGGSAPVSQNPTIRFEFTPPAALGNGTPFVSGGDNFVGWWDPNASAWGELCTLKPVAGTAIQSCEVSLAPGTLVAATVEMPIPCGLGGCVYNWNNGCDADGESVAWVFWQDAAVTPCGGYGLSLGAVRVFKNGVEIFPALVVSGNVNITCNAADRSFTPYCDLAFTV